MMMDMFTKEEERRLYECILTAWQEKPVLIRHDVDNIYDVYGPGITRKIKKIINTYTLLLMSINVKVRRAIPNYLSHLWFLFDIENKYQCRASYFFRPITIPTKEIVKYLKFKGHEIGYHSDRNQCFRTFYQDLKILERETNTKINGFTKHGFSRIRSGGKYIEKKFIVYGVKSRLKYFAQGTGHAHWELPHNINGLWVFGHHITLKKTSMHILKNYLNKRLVPLILIHPEDIFIKGVLKKFEYVLSHGKCITIQSFIEVLEKCLREVKERE